jgi:DNA primase
MSAPVALAHYTLSEHQFANLASEFYGRALFPAGNHECAYLEFAGKDADERRDNRIGFFDALKCFRKKEAA